MSGPLGFVLHLGVFGGMVALCVVGWDIGGVGGAIGGAAGALLGAFRPGHDFSERVGNIYLGTLVGMPVGLLTGGAYLVGWPLLQSLYR